MTRTSFPLVWERFLKLAIGLSMGRAHVLAIAQETVPIVLTLLSREAVSSHHVQLENLVLVVLAHEPARRISFAGGQTLLVLRIWGGLSRLDLVDRLLGRASHLVSAASSTVVDWDGSEVCLGLGFSNDSAACSRNTLSSFPRQLRACANTSCVGMT